VLPLGAWLLAVLVWAEALGFWGPIVFMFLYVPACLLMFPDVMPNAAAGAIWGVWVGSLAVLAGRALGSMATFMLMRRVGRSRLERRMARDPRFHAVADAVAREGFRIVVLLRLCPIFPAIMLNYGLGLTRVSPGAFALGTFVGMIPRTLFVAYAGAGTRSVAEVVRGDGMAAPGQQAYTLAGVVVSLIVLVILARKARRLLQEATQPGVHPELVDSTHSVQ
jgi:uncharacterized membrane protein YdjX (TVP38/TMEM64 family)